MEHFRQVNRDGEVTQWVDAELCMVLDVVTGKPERFGKHHNAMGTLEDALECVKRHGFGTRMVVVRLNCVKGETV